MTNSGETDLQKLLQTLEPQHHPGEYVFCVVDNLDRVKAHDIVMVFREQEGFTVIVKRELADRLGLAYEFIAAWITLTVHSSLSAVGLTAAVSNALSANGISCNVVAAFYHDHLFVDAGEIKNALRVLSRLAEPN